VIAEFNPAAEDTLPMDDPAPHLDTILELEARQEDLLRRLEALDKQVEKVLAEAQSARNPVDFPGQQAGGQEVISAGPSVPTS
jgi:hypothetical protein